MKTCPACGAAFAPRQRRHVYCGQRCYDAGRAGKRYPNQAQTSAERAAKAAGIDLGLAVSGALLPPGRRRTIYELAAFCGCSHERIRQISDAAILKLRRRLSAMGIRPGIHS